MNDKIIIYTDGSCSGNPGPGGWASVIIDLTGAETILSGNDANTTNNRMELMGVLAALRYIGVTTTPITLYSDSQYVVNGVKWAVGWRKNNWVKGDGKPALNAELWSEILSLTDKLNIEFVWVKGHAGNKYNELCNSLAVSKTQKASEKNSSAESSNISIENEPITSGARARMIFDELPESTKEELMDLFISTDNEFTSLLQHLSTLNIPFLTNDVADGLIMIIGLRALKRAVTKKEFTDE